MKIDEVPPVEKVREVVEAIDPDIQVVVVDGAYLRPIEGKWYGHLNRPKQHVEDPDTGVVGPPYATVQINPARATLAAGDVLGEFSKAAADLSRYVAERVAVADAQIEP